MIDRICWYNSKTKTFTELPLDAILCVETWEPLSNQSKAYLWIPRNGMLFRTDIIGKGRKNIVDQPTIESVLWDLARHNL